MKTKIFDLRKKYINIITDKKDYIFSLEDWATDEYYDEQEKLITDFKKTLKFDKNTYLNIYKDITNWVKNEHKDTLSHELKHLFDYYISNYKQNSDLSNWDNNSHIKITSKKEEIESLFSDLLYIFDKRELSAFQQQLISHIKHSKNNKDLINDLNVELKLIINSSISTFPSNPDKYLRLKFLNVFSDIMYNLAKAWETKYIYTNTGDLHTPTYEEICYIIKEFKLSEKILGKKFNGKTRDDFNKFLEQCFNKIKNIYINILKKATKHLV